MDIFKRNSLGDSKTKEETKSQKYSAAEIAKLHEKIKDLELDIFDLKKANACLIIENTQLKAWNTTAENQSNEWFTNANPTLSSIPSPPQNQDSWLPRQSLSVNVEEANALPVIRHSSESTVVTVPGMRGPDESSHTAQPARLHRQNTIIFTNDTEFENFKLSKTDIQMKCQVGKGSFGVVWKGLYKDNPVAVKLFISEEIDIRSEVFAMSKVVGLEHVMDLIGE
jgi:hypothetical protein